MISNFVIGDIEVVNMAVCKDFGDRPGDVRVDRATRWGNHFYMANDSDEERDRVCDAYERDLKGRCDKSRTYLSPLMHAKRLGCWCAPKRCHADSLARAIHAARKTEG
jgi:hypothetical protein